MSSIARGLPLRASTIQSSTIRCPQVFFLWLHPTRRRRNRAVRSRSKSSSEVPIVRRSRGSAPRTSGNLPSRTASPLWSTDRATFGHLVLAKQASHFPERDTREQWCPAVGRPDRLGRKAAGTSIGMCGLFPVCWTRDRSPRLHFRAGRIPEAFHRLDFTLDQSMFSVRDGVSVQYRFDRPLALSMGFHEVTIPTRQGPQANQHPEYEREMEPQRPIVRS